MSEKLKKEVLGEVEFILKVESKHLVLDTLRFETPTGLSNSGIK